MEMATSAFYYHFDSCEWIHLKVIFLKSFRKITFIERFLCVRHNFGTLHVLTHLILLTVL